MNHDETEAIWQLFNSGLLEGWTDDYLKVAIPVNESLIGKTVKVKIAKVGYPSNEDSLFGE